MSDLSKRLANLSPEKLELLTRQLKERERTDARPEAIPRRDASAPFVPLSFPQQRMWFFDRLEPGNPINNAPVVVRLKGRLNVGALTRSINEIVKRHEILRTTFGMVEENPVQIVAPYKPLQVQLQDLEALSDEVKEAEIFRCANREALRPFDLTEGPLLRLVLLRLNDEQHVLVISIHHIIWDGWSLGIFLREMVSFYEAFTTGRPDGVEELPLQYADFALWQRAHLRGERLEKQLDYWKAQLDGLPPVLHLPTARPRPNVQSFRGTRRFRMLPSSLSGRLKELSRREGATLFMTLAAAFATLLNRYSGQDDIVVGTPIANRTRKELSHLIGLFINTLVLRADLSGDPTFRELLARVRKVTLGAYAHQDLPFEKLVETLQPERDTSRQPLFQVMLVFQNTPLPPLDMTHLSASVLEVDVETAKFDLTLSLAETGDGLSASLEYSTALFDAPFIERMLGHFQTILESVAANPAERLSRLSMLCEDERRLLLEEWNDNRLELPEQQRLQELFEEHAARRPAATAIVRGEEAVSYAELNARANRLAHRLRALGVAPDTLVGVYLERSIETVVSFLGILKAGGAYLPLDPTYPRERVAFMLEDAAAPVLLTRKNLLSRLPAHRARVVCLDSEQEEFNGHSAENPSVLTEQSHTAYVIYTSGSTGKPKGVAVEHRGLCNLADAQARAFDLNAESRVLQFASPSFDASVFEMVMAFGVGATLYLPTEEASLPGASLVSLLREKEITIVTLPPSALAALPEEPLPALCTITVAGEACPAELVGRWAQGERRFFNLYGPTEATVWTTMAGCVDGATKPPIGCPIQNTETFILSPHLNPVPVGVVGELFIGGISLARGYLNRPELTAEKFVPNLFSNTPGARLYRTGDLARHLPDGQIEFIGRADHQVKVRGFRIELGEIEAALGAHTSVRECVVTARESDAGEKSLAAYVVLRGGMQASNAELRGHLRQRLPEYMIPASFVKLDSLPLSPNGKINLKALPAPLDERAEAETAYVPPRTEIEREVAAVWQQVLSLKEIGIEDNFFDLGGHSLLMLKVHGRLQDSFGSDLSLLTLFKYPTVKLLAGHLGRETSSPLNVAQGHDRALRQREAIGRQRRILGTRKLRA